MKSIITVSNFFMPLALCLLLTPTAILAQQQDSLQPYHQFIQACNSYQRPPLQAMVHIRRTADVFVTEEDTAVSTAEFCILQQGTYTRFDGVEQVANDSLLLFIGKAGKRMALFHSHTSIANRLGKLPGLVRQDSSLSYLVQNFTATASGNESPSSMVITLNSRSLIPVVNIPRHTMQVVYNPKSNTPEKLLQTQYKLVPLDSASYHGLLQQPGYTGRLINPEGNSYFVVKKYTTEYTYTSIMHNAEAVLPLRVGDCVGRLPGGRYTVVKGFEDYALTEN